MFCYSSLILATHSQCVPTLKQGDVASKCLVFPHPAILLRQAKAVSTYGPPQKRHKTSFWELHLGKFNSPRGCNNTTKVCWLRPAALACFSPRPLLSTGPRRVWAASCSLATVGLLLLSCAWNPISTCSAQGTSVIWPENSLCSEIQAFDPRPGVAIRT